MEDNSLIPFGEKPIRKIWHNDEWWFSIVDVIEILTDSPSPKTYWAKLKKKLVEESANQQFRIWELLKVPSSDGRKRPTDCVNTEGVLRIVMSVPSPKAEPLKLWLAQVGKERIEETENPELSFERAREIYKAKGYPDDWIGYREKSIMIRNELTDEWKKRGIKESMEYSILTAEISKATFGLTPTEHKELKGLTKPSHNLRDHMTNLELIFSILGEEITRKVAIRDDSQGFNENRESAITGGRIAAKSLVNTEKELGEKVISTNNFLNLNNNKKDELPLSDDEPTI